MNALRSWLGWTDPQLFSCLTAAVFVVMSWLCRKQRRWPEYRDIVTVASVVVTFLGAYDLYKIIWLGDRDMTEFRAVWLTSLACGFVVMGFELFWREVVERIKKGKSTP